MRIRWSDNDRYFGPFTYSKDRHYRTFTILLDSGDGDDYPGCRLRLSALGHTFILAIPAIIKPWRQWVPIRTEPTRSQLIESGRDPGYWDQHRKEYGFSIVEGAVHLYYGPQTHDSETTKSKCYFIPWRSWRHVRHSFYDLSGEYFATLPKHRNRLGANQWRNQWEVERAIESTCPTQTFVFRDFDGEELRAVTKIEEREWRLGEGKFKWLSFFCKPKVRRSLKIDFSGETGRRKGSWKGGTVGHSIDMKPGELHESAFRRYCSENDMSFVKNFTETLDTDFSLI